MYKNSLVPKLPKRYNYPKKNREKENGAKIHIATRGIGSSLMARDITHGFFV